MQRRRILTLTAAAAIVAALPPGTNAARPPRARPLVGVIRFFGDGDWFAARLKEGLAHFGYEYGRNIDVVMRHANGSVAVADQIAGEYVRDQVDVLVASATPACHAARKATASIPIVMATAADPQGTGLVRNLARPEGNITGLSAIMPDIAGKQLALLREILPQATRIAYLADRTDPAHARFLAESAEAAGQLGLKLTPIIVSGEADLPAGLHRIAQERVDAVIVQPIFTAAAVRIVAETNKLGVPTLSQLDRYAERGGLLAYGADQDEAVRRAGYFVHRLLTGAKPSDLPVEQPSRFRLVINQRTAKTLGIRVPGTVLLRADHVFE